MDPSGPVVNPGGGDDTLRLLLQNPGVRGTSHVSRTPGASRQPPEGLPFLLSVIDEPNWVVDPLKRDCRFVAPAVLMSSKFLYFVLIAIVSSCSVCSALWMSLRTLPYAAL